MSSFDLCRWFKCQQPIGKPETFYKYVHQALKIQESKMPDFTSIDMDNPRPNDKTWHYPYAFTKMQKFLHDNEETLALQPEQIRALNLELEQQGNFDAALATVATTLSKKIIEGDYWHHENYRPNTLGGFTGVPYHGPDGKLKFYNFVQAISGGMQNMFSTVLGLARIIPDKLLRESKIKFRDFDEFRAKVSELTRANVSLLLGFAKLELNLFFKLLNLQGNHREQIFQPFYNFDSRSFVLDDENNPQKLLPLKSLAIRLIKAIRRKPVVLRYGDQAPIDLKLSAPGCPAVYVRTRDAKRNMVEVFNDLVCDVLDQTVFAQLDKWFTLPNR